jgi:hypothetical protein
MTLSFYQNKLGCLGLFIPSCKTNLMTSAHQPPSLPRVSSLICCPSIAHLGTYIIEERSEKGAQNPTNQPTYLPTYSLGCFILIDINEYVPRACSSKICQLRGGGAAVSSMLVQTGRRCYGSNGPGWPSCSRGSLVVQKTFRPWRYCFDATATHPLHLCPVFCLIQPPSLRHV